MSNIYKAVKFSLNKNDKSHVLDRKYDLFEELNTSIENNGKLFFLTSIIVSALAIAIVVL